MDYALQQKFARGCGEATAGYAAAATAAYTELATQALDFWCIALSGLSDCAPAESVAPRTPEPAFGLSLADWNPFAWFEPRRYEGLMQLDMSTPPALAMFAIAESVPLRGTSKAWPFVHVMIESGVPRSVAWPAAEANAAALDAADAASDGVRQVLASYHTENGFAAVVRSMTPSIVVLAMTLGLSLSPAAVMGGQLGLPLI